jgi:hypothetical protein
VYVRGSQKELQTIDVENTETKRNFKNRFSTTEKLIERVNEVGIGMNVSAEEMELAEVAFEGGCTNVSQKHRQDEIPQEKVQNISLRPSLINQIFEQNLMRSREKDIRTRNRSNKQTAVSFEN